MKELPKRFPEYSIMHKTILKQIKELEEESILKKNQTQTRNKIKMYKSELEKIEKMFPENFFKNETDYS